MIRLQLLAHQGKHYWKDSDLDIAHGANSERLLPWQAGTSEWLRRSRRRRRLRGGIATEAGVFWGAFGSGREDERDLR